jgi:hypothetical protein
MDLSQALACTLPSFLRLRQGFKRARLLRFFCAPVLNCFRAFRGLLPRFHARRGPRFARDVDGSNTRNSERACVCSSAYASTRS